jgi:hypothetical protein
MGQLPGLATLQRHQPELSQLVVAAAQKGERASIGRESGRGIVCPVREDLCSAVTQGEQDDVRTGLHRVTLDPGPHKRQVLAVQCEVRIGHTFEVVDGLWSNGV